jgi:hypothetical protein
MSLGAKLIIVFFAFLLILVGVITATFRERKLSARSTALDPASAQASDGRILAIIFGAILAGMLLTILVAWLVFF